jgi:hypothetical protein
MSRTTPVTNEELMDCYQHAGPRKRRQWVAEGCVTCAGLTPTAFAPRHDASPRCESGKRNHCSCDICF